MKLQSVEYLTVYALFYDGYHYVRQCNNKLFGDGEGVISWFVIYQEQLDIVEDSTIINELEGEFQKIVE